MEEPPKPTAIHYALVVFVLISIINGVGWLLAFKGRDSIPDLHRQVDDLSRQVGDLRQQLDAANKREATARQVEEGGSNDNDK